MSSPTSCGHSTTPYPQSDHVADRDANNVSLVALLGMVDAAERQEVATILSESAARSFDPLPTLRSPPGSPTS